LKRPETSWRELTRDVRWLEYSFGPGIAGTLAIRTSGEWTVMSPASRPPPSALDALERDGRVTALVAPNAYHHLGQAAWRDRFPEAVSYAPEGSLPRLRKKSNVDYRSITDLARPGLSILVPDGMKSPDVLLHAAIDGANVWWLGDLFSNTRAGDQSLLLRILGWLAGSGPGYRRNQKPGLVYVRDRDAWLASIRAALAEHPPAIVVPAHGEPVIDDTTNRTSALVA
jgi:hypothetical protein